MLKQSHLYIFRSVASASTMSYRLSMWSCLIFKYQFVRKIHLYKLV